MKSVRLFALALFLPLIAHAQTKSLPPKKLPPKKSAPSRVGLDATRAIRLNYGYPAWNKNPTQIDSASFIMREGGTGRLVQIQLEETEPDSNVFSGLFSVQWESISQLAPEFYVPPQELLKTSQGLKKLNEMISKNEVRRVPFILRRGKNGQQFIEIFDNKEQARTAMRAYRAEREALELAKKKVVNESALDTAELATDAKNREAAAKTAADRVRLEQVESRKDDDRETQFKNLSKEEQERRKAEAAKLAAQALEHYRNNRFAEALTKFEQAFELDPLNKSYYFQYGIALYRLDQFNKSLVFISLAEGPDVNPVEKDYYRALNYYRMKETTNALEAFKKVEDAKNPDMSPSASFYLGVMAMEEKKYEDARLAFQKVLDTSKDPKLDERAEEAIEQILRMQQYETERAKKWTLNATLGLNYDNNILQISDSQLDTGTATDTAGWRTLQQASLRYRPVFEANKEFAAQIDIVNMYTVDDSFKYQTELRNSDPFVATLILPYTYKGLLRGKGYKLDLVPGYETITMSIENNESKPILNSILLNVLNTIVMNDNWFSNYNLELRQDKSLLDSSTGDNDASAFKAKLTFGNFIFLNHDKNKILTADLAYTSNAAKGDNATFDRIDVNLGYVGQTYWDMTWNGKISYFQLNYTKNTNGRTDNSYTATIALSKKLSETYSAGFMTSYNLNESNIDTYAYKRWSSMLTFSAGWSL